MLAKTKCLYADVERKHLLEEHALVKYVSANSYCKYSYVMILVTCETLKLHVRIQERVPEETEVQT